MSETREELRAHSRYPYTYSCDWIRMTGLADSRADASRLRSETAKSLGIEDEEYARQLAEQYLDWEDAINTANAEKDKRMKHLCAVMLSVKGED